MKVIKTNNNIRLIHNDENYNIIMNNFECDMFTFLVEKDGTLLYVSDNFFKIIKSNNNFKILSDIICENSSYEKVRKMMLESIFTNIKVENEIIINKRIYNINITPIFDSNDIIISLLINACDTTKNKKIEEEIEDLKIKLIESDSIKNNFLSNISHELRTPLNAIIGFSELLIDEYGDEFSHFLTPINSNAKHLYELLNNVLDSSKIESNNFDILYEKFCVCELIEELSDMFLDLNKKINKGFVDLKFIKNDNIKIISDYIRLKQVLFNIISNAIKFTNVGSITISYIFDEKNIIFIIKDTGIGIPKDKFKYVFDRFWQGDSSPTKSYKGTGLGLSISKNITELLGGEIWFESEEKSGTTFNVKLKIEEFSKKNTIIKNKIEFSTNTILVVDEVPVNYSLLGIYLNSLNFNILTASDGNDAIKMIEKNKNIDLVILDNNIVDYTNIDLINKIKEYSLKIITKSDRIGCIQNTKIKGVLAHIQTPINKEKLLNLFNSILK